MDEDIMKIMEQVAAQADMDQRKRDIEAYINTVVTRTTDTVRSHIMTCNVGIPEPTYSELEKWQLQQRNRLALQFGDIVRFMLRKELLGE